MLGRNKGRFQKKIKMKIKIKYLVIIPSILIILFIFLLVNKNTKEENSMKQTIFELQTDSLKLKEPELTEVFHDLNKESPNKEHPRLMATHEDFERIKRNIHTDKNLKIWYEKLITNANLILSQPAVVYEKTDGKRLLPVSRKVLDRVITLSMSYKLTGNNVYAERAWKELGTVSNNQVFYDWNPSHFLDTAEMSMAVSIGYDWLYEYLSQEQKLTLQNAIINNAFKPALMVFNHTANPNKITTVWKNDKNNWNVVVNSSLIISALTIGDESSLTKELSGGILKSALSSIRNSLSVYIDGDGSHEGPSYWNYATLYLSYLFSSMQTALGTDYNYSNLKGLSETGFYPLYISHFSREFNTGDAAERNFESLPQLFWLADRFNNPNFTSMALDMYNPMNLIWYSKDTITEKNINDLPLDRHFKDPQTGIITMRSSWDDENGNFIGIHAGDNKASHGDLDIGTFVLDSQGVRWAIDLGYDDYNLPGYFEENRWLYYRKRAEGNNTIVINPDQNADQLPDAQGKIKNFVSKDNKASVTIDMTSAYPEAEKLERTISLIDNRTKTILEDKINLNQKSELYWFMHTRANIGLSKNKKTAILVQDNKLLYVSIHSPSDAEFTIQDAKPLPTSILLPGQNENKYIKKLTIHMKNIKNSTIRIEFSTEPID